MNNFSNIASRTLVTALLVSLAACGGGGGSDSPPVGGGPPSPAPAPPPPPPPPAPAATVPPVSPTVQDITDGHTVGASRWGNAQTDGSAKAGLDCILNPPQTLQYHAHLSILVNNEAQAIPAGLGSAPQPSTHCFYAIHVHDSSGKIHVTPSAAGTFTLGQLFEIWGQPLTSTNVAGVTGLPVEIFVTDNGTVTKVEQADWTNIELKSHREITIGLGTAVTEIPNFTWSD